MEKSLHPGAIRRPNQISYESPVIVEEPVVEEPVVEEPVVEEPVVEEEVTVFNPEEAVTDGNPFPEEEEPEEEEPVDYESMTVPELRALLAERGLIVSGIKAELIARLEEDDAGLSEQSETLAEPEETPSEEAVSSEEEVSEYGGTEEQ
tara:strand:+ start:72 stop:518 length:447 start_codon:yes stop_codon:yes gene_type:complete